MITVYGPTLRVGRFGEGDTPNGRVPVSLFLSEHDPIMMMGGTVVSVTDHNGQSPYFAVKHGFVPFYHSPLAFSHHTEWIIINRFELSIYWQQYFLDEMRRIRSLFRLALTSDDDSRMARTGDGAQSTKYTNFHILLIIL